MLKKELQTYLDRTYVHADLREEHSLVGPVHIRFELGGNHRNGTVERVKQAVERALIIFDSTFDHPDQELYILIYDYPPPHFFESSPDFLYRQFEASVFQTFYNQTESILVNSFTQDVNGRDVLETEKVRIVIGKIRIADMNVEQILRGIANAEMGFSPGIDQKIYFFNPQTDRAFHMYDDRGCYVWSNQADKIRDLFERHNEWIEAYHRPEIEKLFLP